VIYCRSDKVRSSKGGAAGEFGHMTIGKGAPVTCGAGSHECWEAFASESAALARYATRRGSRADHVPIDFRELVDRGLAGDKDAESCLD